MLVFVLIFLFCVISVRVLLPLSTNKAREKRKVKCTDGNSRDIVIGYIEHVQMMFPADDDSGCFNITDLIEYWNHVNLFNAVRQAKWMQFLNFNGECSFLILSIKYN